MRFRTKSTTFFIQITDGFLKVIKCNSIFTIEGLSIEHIPVDISEKDLFEKLQTTLRSLSYKGNSIVISLPRAQAICRYLKIPSQIPSEIDKIISFQAPHYLPYHINELITGYEVVGFDKEGYSYVNLVMVYRDLIERYFRIFKELRPKNITVALSSYGLCNIYNYIEKNQLYPVMVIDIDFNHTELAIISHKKLVFSRTFKLNRSSPESELALLDEINKTQSAYSKDVSKDMPGKIIIFSQDKETQKIQEFLSQHLGIPIEICFCSEKLKIPPDLLKKACELNVSIVNLLGLALGQIPESFNLLPPEVKEARLRIQQRRNILKKVFFVGVMLFMLIVGLNKNIDNKTRYLQMLKVQLDGISQEARPLEQIDKGIKVLESNSKKEISIMELIYELAHSIPKGVSLTSISYDQGNQIFLRAQAQELNLAFDFVKNLESSKPFRTFEIKMRHATKRRIQTTEFVDFEIICLKR